MTNPHTTKLRLIYERKKREYETAKRQRDEAWMEYLKAMRADGLCAGCEKPLAECKCVFLAGGSQGWSLTSVADVQSVDGITTTRL